MLNGKLKLTQFDYHCFCFYSILQSQTGEEIAIIIKDVILSEKPHLRYLTNEKHQKEFPSTKLTDVTGDSVVDELVAQLT